MDVKNKDGTENQRNIDQTTYLSFLYNLDYYIFAIEILLGGKENY